MSLAGPGKNISTELSAEMQAFRDQLNVVSKIWMMSLLTV